MRVPAPAQSLLHPATCRSSGRERRKRCVNSGKVGRQSSDKRKLRVARLRLGLCGVGAAARPQNTPGAGEAAQQGALGSTKERRERRGAGALASALLGTVGLTGNAPDQVPDQ